MARLRGDAGIVDATARLRRRRGARILAKASRRRELRMSLEARFANFGKLIGSSAELKWVASGFTFTDGPIWHARDHSA